MIDGLNTSQNTYEILKASTLRSRLDMSLDIKKIFKALDSTAETEGAGVIFIDAENVTITLRKFNSNCRINPINVVLREPPKHVTPMAYTSRLTSNVRESKLVGEAVGTALSCSSAVLAWVVVFGSGSIIPLTGGASAVVTYIGYSAAAASTLQCFVGLGRTVAEIKVPDKLDWLDSQEWYQETSAALDVVSLGGAIISGAITIKMVQRLTITGKSMPNILKGLTRQQKARLTKEIYRQNIPGISNKIYKQLVRTGDVKRRYSQTQISDAIIIQLKDALGASLSFTGSAMAGNVNTLAVGLYEELTIEH
ncbi:hypothetical protein [Moritella yayanosii]|uniref:NAD synthetase n=1 Tax=Moritella yayanosii TaxID=69539 RepID=A0A330LLK2_9GAMM|nr:hypothetical protein [Moritella yayanosii]SQD76718.1 conserved protein of unknown function [Moritella yayanosii]